MCKKRRMFCNIDELNNIFTIFRYADRIGTILELYSWKKGRRGGADEEGKQTMRGVARNMVFLMKSIALGKEAFGLPEKEKKGLYEFLLIREFSRLGSIQKKCCESFNSEKQVTEKTAVKNDGSFFFCTATS
mgnify:CR=1 FL=1